MRDRQDPTRRWAELVVGFALHSVLATLGAATAGLVLYVVFRTVLGPVSPAVNLKILFLSISIVFIGAIAVPRWCGRSAPWVGIPGLFLLWLGAHDLLKFWSPDWSHQTRGDYLLSQLFCIRSGCGATEGLYALLFGWPSFCLLAYSVSSVLILAMTRKIVTAPRTAVEIHSSSLN